MLNTFDPPTMENPFRVIDLLEDEVDHLVYRKGQVIYCEGSTPLGAYFVYEGKVKTSITGSDGKEQILRISSSGDMLSYANLLSGTKYTTWARTLEDSTLLFVPKDDFWNFITQQQQLFAEFVMLTSRDLLQAETRIADLAYKPVRGRLADALISLARKFRGEELNIPTLSITRSDLACFVGTAKETVNRLLSEFRNESLIETEGSRISILNMDGLRKISRLYT